MNAEKRVKRYLKKVKGNNHKLTEEDSICYLPEKPAIKAQRKVRKLQENLRQMIAMLPHPNYKHQMTP